MNRRRAVILGMGFLWLVSLAIAVKIATDRLPIPSLGNSVADSLSPEVASDTQVGQLFTAPLPGLYRIEFVLAPSAAYSRRPITIHLKSDPAAAEDLWTAELDGHGVQDTGSYGFEFEPIRGSEGQTYYFYLEAGESGPGDAIALRYYSQGTLEGASAYVNGEPVAGNLQFNSFYSLRTRDRLALLLTRMAEGRSYLLGTKGFYIGLAVAYALVLGMFLWLVGRAVLETREERL